jgi:hypothetical protein
MYLFLIYKFENIILILLSYKCQCLAFLIDLTFILLGVEKSSFALISEAGVNLLHFLNSF